MRLVQLGLLCGRLFGRWQPARLAVWSHCVLFVCDVCLFPVLVLGVGFTFWLPRFLFIAFLFLLLNIENIQFEQVVHRIYHTELQLNKANASDTEAGFLVVPSCKSITKPAMQHVGIRPTVI